MHSSGSNPLCAVHSKTFLWIALLALATGGCERYYKMCNDQCVMRGGYIGSTFDHPCAIGIANSVVSNLETPGTNLETPGTLISLDRPVNELVYALPLHDPVFPRVSKDCVSEAITFYLTPSGPEVVKKASLYIRISEILPEVIAGESAPLDPINIAAGNLVTVSWEHVSGGIFKRKVTHPGTSARVEQGLFGINYVHIFRNVKRETAAFITYRFDVQYGDGTEDQSEVTFALQNFYEHEKLKDFPAPIYGQGPKRDFIDVMFIPARNHCVEAPLTPEFYSRFHAECGSMIKDVIFAEPSMRFWRRQFNFWITKKDGMAMDYERCGEQCFHEVPEELNRWGLFDIEVKALLHEGFQRDFSDGQNVFSAQVNSDAPNGLLHELGHSYGLLWDEYRGGVHNAEGIFSNNWDDKKTAEEAAPSRNKIPDDVRKIN